MYKVFFKDSIILVTDNKKDCENTDLFIEHCDDVVTQKFILSLLKRDEVFTAGIYSSEIELVFEVLKKLFQCVEAAGGAVINNERILLIKRFGYTDLPKGHIEHGENTEECAIREVEEECSITDVVVEKHLCDTYHIYLRSGHWHL